jgi:hypothetical protein
MGMIATLLRLMDYRHFKGRTGPEDKLAIEVASMLRAATVEGKLRATWTHVPHEVGGKGKLAAIRMALAKAMGLIKGSADYVFVAENGGGWIEIKVPGNYPTPIQRDFGEWCRINNVRHAICRSTQEVEDTLRSWGLLA